MVNAKDVQSLNSRIETINTNRTKAKTQQEMLQQRLEEELDNYKSQFGVDLKKGSLAQTKVLINAEVKKVVDEVQKEYELKEKVVSAIESGDYEEAYKLLGIKQEVEELVEEPIEEVSEEPTEVEVKPEVENPVISDFDMESLDLDDVDEPMDLDMEEDIELPISKKKEVPEGTSNVEDAFSGMEVEDDDLPGIDDSDFGFKDELMGSKFEI